MKARVGSKRRMWKQDTDSVVAEGGKGKGANEEALVRVLRELSTVQRNLANLQVELQGRQVCVPRLQCFAVACCIVWCTALFL